VKYGPLLRLPASIDGTQLMAAVAQNESTMGADRGPRHEAVYDEGGMYASNTTQASLLKRYGRAAACSYGPWQVMFVNCPGYTPTELETNADSRARAFVAHFNSYVHGKNPASIEQIGQIYNGGHITSTPSAGVQRYCRDLQHSYDTLEVTC
jgi:hypothetical protein